MSDDQSSSQENPSDGAETDGHEGSDGESQSGSTVESNSSVGRSRSESSTAPDEERTFLSDLIWRRVPQVLAGYLGVTWTLFELMQWLTEQYLVSPYLGRAILFGLLMLLPAVVLVTYRHGRPGPDSWTSYERWGTVANVALALLVLGFAYGDVELGSMVKTVSASPTGSSAEGTTGDTLQTAVRKVPKKEFRKRVSLFYFDEAEGAKADTALRRASAVALYHDLDQDNFIGTRFMEWHSSKLEERDYEEGLNVPLALKREIAQWEASEYIFSGTVGQTGDGYRLTTQLHKTKTGERIAKHSYRGGDLLPLVDQATKQLKQDLRLPRAHRESVTDLPVTQVFTPSLQAAKHYAEGYHFKDVLGAQDRKALRDFSNAAEVDSTFALASAHAGLVHWRFGHREKAQRSFRQARRHDYRLSKSRKYWVKTVWLSLIKQRLKEALHLSDRWTKLHPYDPRGWELKASVHADLLQHQSTLGSYKRALEVFPKSKDLQFEVGEWSVKVGNLQSATRHFTTLTEKYPEEEGGYLWLGIARWKLGNLDSAQKAFKTASRIDQDGHEQWMSGLYQATGRFDKALEIFDRHAHRNDADREEGYRLLHHYWLTGRLEESKSVLDSLMNAEVKHPDFHYLSLAGRACNYYKNSSDIIGNLTSKVREFGVKYGDTIPTYRVIYRAQLGNCLTAVDSLQVAERNFAAADSIIKQTERPILRLGSHLDFFMGRLYEELGEYDQASNHYERFLRIHPAHITSLIWTVGSPRLQLALTYQKAGELEKAQKTFENALDLYPAHPYINYHYGRLLVEQGASEEATSHLRRALKGWAPADSSFKPKHRAKALVDSLSREPA